METPAETGRPRAIAPPDRRHILVGTAIILMGLAFLANQGGWLAVTISGRHWPLILLFLGVLRVLLPSRDGARRGLRGGIWLLSIGVWGLISEFGLFGLDYATSWPLLVVAAGVNIVLRSFDGRGTGAPVREN